MSDAFWIDTAPWILAGLVVLFFVVFALALGRAAAQGDRVVVFDDERAT